MPQQFAHTTQDYQYQRESEPHHQAIDQRRQRRLLDGKGLGAGDDGAIGCDQWQEYAQHLVKIIKEGIHRQLNGRDDGGDDQHKDRDPDFGTDNIADQGY